jgi:hypothetical protein
MKFAYLAALLAGAAFGVHAAETTSAVPHFDFPEEYRVSAAREAAPGRESAQFSGISHTVVAPIFDGTNGNTSYIRLANTSTAAQFMTVTVVGTPTGRDYGSFTYNVAAWASPQKSIHVILRDAGITSGYVGGDTGFSLYLSTPATVPLAFQHVVYNANTRFFENVSICTYRPNLDYTAQNRFLANIHTDQAIMSAYPANVSFHHFGGEPATYLAEVYETETGTFKGNFSFTMRPNETFVAPMSYYEQRVGWTPVLGESHANILFRRDDIGIYTGSAGQRVYNAALDASINMSQFCAINPG